jgi:hypothetical protein
MNQRVKGIMMLLALWLMPAPLAFAQGTPAPDPWYSRSPRPRDFAVPKISIGNTVIELPRNWQIVPGYGEVLLTAAERPRGNNPSAAAIVIEQAPLQASLTENDITDALAQAEVRVMQERQPDVQNFDRQLKEVDSRRFILIQYSRTGLTGRDRVVQYSIPAGNVMFRLICIAPEGQIAAYQPIFAHVAASFKPS